MKLSVAVLPGRRILYLRDLLRELVARDMKLRYKRSFLGFAWSILNPLAQLLVFNFVFTRVLPLNIPDYPSFLFIGLLVWNWFQSSLVMATGAIVDNRELIKRPGFPPGILPIISVSTNFIHFLLALPILFIFLIISGIHLTGLIFLLPILFGVQYLFILSLAYFVATFHVYFRDTQYLLGIFLLLGFYLSPVFYDPSHIPTAYQKVYYLNPMVTLIEDYRAILMEGSIPDIVPLLLIILVAALLLWIGFSIFSHSSRHFVEEL